MEILNQIGKKASEAYKITADKTGKIAKETKLKLKMSDLKSKVNGLYEEIGKRVYENHIIEDNEACSKEIEEQCIKIDVLNDEIENILQQCLELRNKRQCKNCHTEIEIEANFCYNCGEKQEKIVEKCVEEESNNENAEENECEDSNTEPEVLEPEVLEAAENLEKTVEVESNVSENLEITEDDVINIGEDEEAE